MKMNVTFSEVGDKTFHVRFQRDCQSFGASFGEIQHLTEYVGGEPYEGEYSVVPKVKAQVLSTKEKVMLDDVTIMAIPYAEVTNISNGKTVTIG